MANIVWFPVGPRESVGAFAGPALVTDTRSRAGFTPHGLLVSVPAYSRFPETMPHPDGPARATRWP
jgi:hypothetical protein